LAEKAYAESSPEVLASERQANAMLTEENERLTARLTALESERDALLAAAGKEAVAVDAQRMTEIARKWIKEGSEASPEFYWGDFYDCVREIIAAGDGRDALESALRQIADQEHIELMLDPTWAQRIAIAALSQKAGEQQ
jgi:hypothetical protein